MPIKHISTKPYPINISINNDTYLNDTYLDSGKMAIIEAGNLRLKEDGEYFILLRELKVNSMGKAEFKTMESFDKDGYVVLYEWKKPQLYNR